MVKTTVRAHPRKGTKGVRKHSRETPLKRTVPNRSNTNRVKEESYIRGIKPKYAKTHFAIKKIDGGREIYGRYWFKGEALAETKRLHGKRRGRNPYYVADAK